MEKITENQIADWKAKYGTNNVYAIKTDDKVCYLKKPDVQMLISAQSMSQNNLFKFAEVILKNCWLGGDEDFKTDVQYFSTAAVKISELTEIKNAEMVKL
jgi:hypothetical protein